MTTRLPSPVAQWTESPASGAALSLVRVGWRYNAATQQWTVALTPGAVNGQLAAGPAGTYQPTLLTAITPGAVTAAAVLRGDSVLIY